MDFRQLRNFVAVAQSGSVTAASKTQRISQPALSAQVNQLEQQLGVILLKRHSRGVELTPAGTVLLEHATAILDRLAQTEVLLAPFKDKHQIEITLGVTPSSGRWLVPELLDACARSKGLTPQITLRQGLTGQLMKDVAQGTIDLAFCYSPAESEDYLSTALYFEKFFLIGPPALVDSSDGDLAFDRLPKYPLVLGGRSHVTRQIVERVAALRGVELNIGIEVDPIGLRREMLTEHSRCSIMPVWLVLDDVRRGLLAARPICSPTIGRTLSLLARKGLSQSVLDFVLSTVFPVVERIAREGELGWLHADNPICSELRANGGTSESAPLAKAAATTAVV